MRRRTPRPLSAAVDSLIGRLAPPGTLAAVQTVWDQAVGEVVAEHARPVGERDGVLRVACDEAVWAHELELLGPDLVRQVNAALGRDAVSALRCQAVPAS